MIRKKRSSMLIKLFLFLITLAGFITWFCLFFDQAVLTRRGTIYRVKTNQKKVLVTFDDGPSPVWTPLILDELKKANIKAVFFMIGHHVKKYPEIARRVVREGHTIGNHGYAHSVLLYYTPAELEEEVKYTEQVIREITGQTTQYFRPPKAWILHNMKQVLKSLGYDVILWSVNTKDWVGFDHRRMVRSIAGRVQPGDILLFHDSGNVVSREGGDRSQTVQCIPLLAKTLRQRGYEFADIKEFLNG